MDPPAVVIVQKFQFTCPSRSTTSQHLSLVILTFVSIHVPLAEHDRAYEDQRRIRIYVSIHVPLAEHDLPRRSSCTRVPVSIHVPLAEHDLRVRQGIYLSRGFNSRAPRGARHSRRK